MNIHEIKNDEKELLVEFLLDRWTGYDVRPTNDGDVEFRAAPYDPWVRLGSDLPYYTTQAQRWDADGRTKPAMDYW